MDTLYDFVDHYITTCFDTQTILKDTRRGSVCRLRHTQSHRLYICRRFKGSELIYSKLLQVRCDHLPRIYEAAGKDGNVIVLEEFIQGDTLAELLASGPLSTQETKKIVLQICDALYVLHSTGVVHRDIKPENILIQGDTAYLIDLDAARESAPDKEQDTKVLGTIGYAPPEQYGISQTSEQSDIYAMGVLINVMLTKEHPSVQLAGGRWGRIVQRCTMVNPKKRYRSVRILMEAVNGA